MTWSKKAISDLAVCEAVAGKGDRFADEVLAKSFPGCPMKVMHAAMERAYSRGLIECGVSLRSGWLTKKGAALLEQLSGSD